jgi:hypothetical protein
LTKCASPDKANNRAHTADANNPTTPAKAARGEKQVMSANHAPIRGELQKNTAA